MSRYEIEFLCDEYDCDTCGVQYADGWIIRKDGVVVVDKTPSAHCTHPLDFSSGDPYRDILELEGIEVVES